MAEDCQSWSLLSDQVALGQQLRADEYAFLRAHAASCPACQAEANVWSALGMALERPDLLSGRPEAPETLGPTPVSQPWWRVASRRRALYVAAASVAALAAATVLWLAGSNAGSRTQPSELARTAVAARPAAPAHAELVLVAGNASLNGAPASAGQALSVGDRLVVATGRACLSLPPGVTVCAEHGAELGVQKLDERERRLQLQNGHAVARLEPQASGSSFGFVTTVGSIVARGTVFSLQASGAHVALRVHEGAVLQNRNDGTRAFAAPAAVLLSPASQTLDAPEDLWSSDKPLLGLSERFSKRATSELSITSQQPSIVSLDGVELGMTPLSALLAAGSYGLTLTQEGLPPIAERLMLVDGSRLVRSYRAEPALAPDSAGAAPGVRERVVPPPAALLAEARELRQQARFKAAAAAYERLLQKHPASAEARAATVSLGELQLSQLGDARGALRSFDSYLRGGGALSQEANYGRIRALQRLGRTREAEQAISAYLAAYPKSAQAATLRKAGH